MKTIEKSAQVSKSLSEVWEWKDEVYEDIKDKSFKEKQKYFEQGLKKAVNILKGKLKRNADGSYSIIR